MRQKIRIVGLDGKALEKEFEVPNKAHLEAQIKFKASVFKPKKGKGSFRRRSKHQNKKDEEF